MTVLRLSAGRRRSSRADTVPTSVTSLTWPIVGAVAGAILYALAPQRDRYPAVLAAVSCFAILPALLPRARPVRATPICPLNWTIGIFFVQLVVLPVLLVYSGALRGALPFLPSDRAINIALLISCLAYAGFCAGYHLDSFAIRSVRRLREDRTWQPQIGAAGPFFVILGLAGLVLAFHSPGALVDYYEKAGQYQSVGTPGAFVQGGPGTHPGGLAWNLSLVLRPFLGFGAVLLWCRWLDGERAGGRLRAALYTLAAAGVVVFTYSTYSYNRGAFVAPVVALLAVYSVRVRRVGLVRLLVLGLAAFAFLTAYHVFRGSGVSLGQAIKGHGASIVGHTNLNEELQTYAAGPQFTGYLLQQTDYARTPHYGSTLVASVLSPVPIVGKPFRDSAGAALYNGLIYGDLRVRDQVVPAQGELFINFNLAGVLVGYLLLGLGVRRLQKRFAAATTSIERFVWQYAATWVAFLVVGGLAVVSQIFIYFMWPAYVLALLSRRQSSAGRTLLPGWQTHVGRLRLGRRREVRWIPALSGAQGDGAREQLGFAPPESGEA